tara:strand:+ start:242 stop:535 length:294 start_codon:yes stop_codon:yes gene_type:complete
MDSWEGLDDDWFLKNFDLEPLDVEDLQDMANRNSYDILINRRKLSDIVDEGMALAHNPDKLIVSEIEKIMEYFIETEEYEKCAKLRDLIWRVNIIYS